MKTKIYYADVTAIRDEAVKQKIFGMLPPDRQAKAERLLFDKDRELSMGASYLLYMALKDHGIDPNTADIKHTEYRKPYLVDHPDFHYNISHSGTKVMCVVSPHECGCDVQNKNDYKYEVANRFFTEEEQAYIDSQENKVNAFYRIWSLKESFTKAMGLGLRLSFTSFSIHFEEEIKVIQQENDKSYHFYEFDLDPNYTFTACVESHACEEVIVEEVQF